MVNKLIYPCSNPLQFFSTNLIRDARFNSKDFGDFNFPETILPWEQMVDYAQPWQKNDTIPLQLQTNVGPVNWVLKRWCDDVVIDTLQLDQKQQSINEPGLFIYELSAPLADYDEGMYYAVLQFGDPLVFELRTGKLDLRILHEVTQLAEFSHHESREDVIYETGWLGNVRLHSVIKFLGSKQIATVYDDQVLNSSSLRAQKYRAFQLRVGARVDGLPGIPDYFSDMIGSFIGNSNLKFDGKSFTVKAGADMEPTEEENYPLRGWAVELRERYVRGSRIYENDNPINAQVAVMVNVDSKGFGNSNSGSQTAVIDVE